MKVLPHPTIPGARAAARRRTPGRGRSGSSGALAVTRPNSKLLRLLDVAALRQSLADLSRLDSGQQPAAGATREAKADEQAWKQAFGSGAARSKPIPCEGRRLRPLATRASLASDAAPRRLAASASSPERIAPASLASRRSSSALSPSRRHSGHRAGGGSAERHRRGGRLRVERHVLREPNFGRTGPSEG